MGHAYPGVRRNVTPLGFGSSSSSSGTTTSGARYSKLALVATPFGKDKKIGYSVIEKWIHRYNRRLSSTGRSSLCTIIAGTILSVFFLSQTLISDFTYKTMVGAIIVAMGAILFGFWLLSWILRFDEGPAEMREVAGPIHEGSEAFFLVQYGTISKITFVFAGMIFLAYIFRDPSNSAISTTEVSSFGLATVTSLTFIFGALCSALSGYSGMWVSVRANVRVASAARRCYNDALQLCFRGGAFSSVINVALAVGGISAIMVILNLLYPTVPFVQMPLLLVGYGFGASLVAMFAQLGGGIYTKAADVGADLVGKIEAGISSERAASTIVFCVIGIPEDDARNPAVIADLVGDNVGDCAGQCADLFESIAAEIISAMILGGALASEAKMTTSEAAGM